MSVHVLQVKLPDTLKGRFGHSTTVVHTSSTLKKLVMYGGLDEITTNQRDSSNCFPVAETTVVDIGEHMYDHIFDITSIFGGQWRSWATIHSVHVHYSLSHRVVPRKLSGGNRDIKCIHNRQTSAKT